MHLLKLITFVVAFSMVNTNCLNTIASGKSTKNFLDSIFDKYASNTNTMTLTEFTQLLTKFGIGNMKVKCNKDDADCVKKLHIVKRKKRDLPDAYNTTLHKSHMLSHNKKVLIIIDLKLFALFFDFCSLVRRKFDKEFFRVFF